MNIIFLSGDSGKHLWSFLNKIRLKQFILLFNIYGKSILIADNDEDFIDKIILIKNGALRKKISDNSKVIFNDNYSLE